MNPTRTPRSAITPSTGIQPTPSTAPSPPAPVRTITWRSVGIALVLIPLNALWIVMIEQAWGNIFSTTLSLFFNVVVSLLFVLGLNAALHRWAPRQALTPAELTAVYSMLAVSAGIGGLDAIQILIPVMTHGTWFATPSNHWDTLFHGYLPRWLTVADPEALRGLYNGYATLYSAAVLRAWAVPVLCWLGFIAAMLWVFLCMGALFRRQWTEHERLTYPVVQLPLALIQDSGGLLRQRLFRIGALVAGGLDLLSGFAHLYPSLPSASLIGYDISPWFTELPWRDLGWTPISIYPFVIGLGFLLPVDLLLSCWLFHMVWKSQKVVASAIGYGPVPSFPPWIDQQTLGAYLGVAVMALWKARPYLRRVFRQAIDGRGSLPEAEEPMSYRSALMGVGLGYAAIVAFCWLAGMKLWAAALFFALFFVIALALGRLRAELGPPNHDLHHIGPDHTLVTVFGTTALGPSTLGVFALFHAFNRAYRWHVLPHDLEGMYLARRTRADMRRFSAALWGAGMFGAAASFWAYLHIAYQLGMAGRMVGWGPLHYGIEAYGRLETHLTTPQPPSPEGMSFIGAGFAAYMLIALVRSQFLGFALHPLGYAISSGWSMVWLWPSLFVAWLLKALILRYGGLPGYRRALPFFYGLILGEFVIGGGWTLAGLAWGFQPWAFWQA